MKNTFIDIQRTNTMQGWNTFKIMKKYLKLKLTLIKKAFESAKWKCHRVKHITYQMALVFKTILDMQKISSK